ncbi:MAG: glycosyltransferase family 4 protein [Candidatus Diapherotrites archaeon]|nr:glycosyltransferase family 4 protein [Candidatus Diapherotrites archaeon]
MKSLVLYEYPPQPDGLSLQGHNLYRGFVSNGFEVMPCNLKTVFQKEWVYKSFKPDVAIGVGFWGNTPLLVRHPKKFGVTPVPWYVADGWVANFHKDLETLPLVVATSQWVKETYMRDGLSGKNMEVVPIGIDTDLFKPIPQNNELVAGLRETLGIKPEEKIILTAGGDTTSKGFQEVLKALAVVDKEFKDWHYVGKTWPSPSQADHRRFELELVEQLGLPKEKITYIDQGCSNDFMTYLLNMCDVYAGPSRLEGFGMIQVEAQACGKPVIAMDAMAFKDTINKGKTGFLARVEEEIKLEQEWAYSWMGFPKKMMIKFDEPKTFAYRANTDDIADALLKLLTDDTLRNKMGKSARRWAVQKFDYRVVAKQMHDLIQDKIDLD